MQKKQTAEELQKLKDNLEQRVAEQTGALTASNRELRDRIQEALVAREEAKYAYCELEQIFEANTSGMRVIDRNQQVIRANQAFARLVGLTSDEILTTKCSEHFACPNADTPRCCQNQIFAGKEYVESEVEITLNNGTRLWVLHSAAPYRNTQGEVIGLVQSFQDISSRKEAELSLRRAFQQWENTFNAMGDIVTIQDKDMRIVQANKAAEKILNIPAEQLIGKYCYAVFRGTDIPCEGCPETRAIHDYHLHTAEIEHRNLNKTFLVSASPLFDEHGVCTGAVHVARDITEQKTLEAHLRQARKMEAIGTLASGIAHDFNNILMVIFGYANFVRTSLETGSEELDDIEQIINAARRAKDLVTQILAFSRREKTEKILLSPAPVIKDVLKFLRPSLPSSIEIRQNIAAGQTRIIADPTQVYQILMNLCINAAHAMEQEGGILDIGLEERTVYSVTLPEHSALLPGRYLALKVSDTGHGIAPEYMERIFDPFFTTKEKGRGTGMGLAVVHGIVKEHGGDIIVHSRPGEGTTFLVLFPVAEQDQGKAPVTNQEPEPGEKEKILVVDDEEALANLLGRILTSFGYEVVLAMGSDEALVILQDRPDFFDLIITDQTMPRMKGTVLAEQLRQLRPGLPIILCTGYSEEINETTAQAKGIHTVLRKPVINLELARAIRNALDDAGR